MPTQEYSSAPKTFSISRLAIIEPIVARRSPPMTTPPSNSTATIVVPCGASGTVPGGTARPPGSRRGSCSWRKSAKDAEPGTWKARGSRPEGSRRSEVTLATLPGGSDSGGATPRPGWLLGRGPAERLLAALLHEGPDEVLGVRLQHVVDLVQDAVDVVVQPLLGGGGRGRGARRVVGLVVAALRALLLLTGHGSSSGRYCTEPQGNRRHRPWGDVDLNLALGALQTRAGPPAPRPCFAAPPGPRCSRQAARPALLGSLGGATGPGWSNA